MKPSKPTPWYLKLPKSYVTGAIHLAQRPDVATCSMVVPTVPGHSEIPNAAEDAVTCLCALQALRRGKIHRTVAPEPYRDWKAAKQNGHPLPEWDAEAYAHTLAVAGAAFVLEYLRHLGSGSLLAQGHDMAGADEQVAEASA